MCVQGKKNEEKSNHFFSMSLKKSPISGIHVIHQQTQCLPELLLTIDLFNDEGSYYMTGLDLSPFLRTMRRFYFAFLFCCQMHYEKKIASRCSSTTILSTVAVVPLYLWLVSTCESRCRFLIMLTSLTSIVINGGGEAL